LKGKVWRRETKPPHPSPLKKKKEMKRKKSEVGKRRDLYRSRM